MEHRQSKHWACKQPFQHKASNFGNGDQVTGLPKNLSIVLRYE